MSPAVKGHSTLEQLQLERHDHQLLSGYYLKQPAPQTMQIAAAVVTRCRPHVKIQQRGTVAQVRAGNGTPAPRVETRYVLEHAVNASHVEVGSRGHTCLTQRPAVPQRFELTVVHLRDEQEGN